MRTVHKFPIPGPGRFCISMPVGAVVLCCKLQRQKPHVWAEVEDTAPLIEHTFFCAGTGHLLPPRQALTRYVGTVLMYDGDLVWHLYEMDASATYE